MPLTTPTAVQNLLAEYDSSMDLNQCIEAGDSLVTSQCITLLNADGTPYYAGGAANSQIELIARYLGAHFYEVNIKRYKFRAAGKVQESTESKVDLRLDQTTYGQTAMVLDYSGSLAALNNSLATVKKPLPSGVKSKFTWLGTDY